MNVIYSYTCSHMTNVFYVQTRLKKFNPKPARLIKNFYKTKKASFYMLQNGTKTFKSKSPLYVKVWHFYHWTFSTNLKLTKQFQNWQYQFKISISTPFVSITRVTWAHALCTTQHGGQSWRATRRGAARRPATQHGAARRAWGTTQRGAARQQ